MRRVLWLCAALLLFAVGGHAQEDISLTGQILERGELVCGISGVLPGFSLYEEEKDTYTGFDVDICRAVAAALLGDADAVAYREVSATDRAAALATGEVDMLSRNTTWTLARDTEWHVTFGPTVFYDGQGVMVRAADEISALEDLDGQTICSNAGTTTELNISDVMLNRELDYILQTFNDYTSSAAAFFSESCDALTADRSALLAQRATRNTPSDYVILDEVLSKEPLSPVSPQGDPYFADVIRWTVFGLINAEELGVSSANVDDHLDSDNPNMQRLLGIGGTPSGDYLGLENDFMVTVLRQVGNYGEIYARHLGPGTPYDLPRGVNALWTDGGLLYAPPFR